MIIIITIIIIVAIIVGYWRDGRGTDVGCVGSLRMRLYIPTNLYTYIPTYLLTYMVYIPLIITVV